MDMEMSTVLLNLATLLSIRMHMSSGERECVTTSGNYSLHSTWQEDQCTQCQCPPSLVPICNRISCNDPGCRFSQGEVLHIPSGDCCPSCTQPARHCQLNSTSKIQNQEFIFKTPCEKCVCYHGNLRCSVVTCPEVRCLEGQKFQKSANQCCPQCVSQSDSCIQGNKTHPDGSFWINGKCTLCSCKGGRAQCRVPSCHEVKCAKDEMVGRDEQGCCPKCVPSSCRIQGKTYLSGQSWKKDVCTHCTCIKGHVECAREECPSNKRCHHNQHLIWKPHQCCPDCAKKTGICESNGTLHYSGDIWRGQQCQICSCHHGNVRCHQLHCPYEECQSHQEKVISADGCCHICKKLKSCNIRGDEFQHQRTWHEGPCRTCMCLDGTAHCFKEKCTQCARSGATSSTACCQCHSAASQSDQPRDGSDLVLTLVKPAVVENGGKVVISAEHLDLQSRNVQQVRLSVVEGPNSGSILEADTERTVTSFQWKDLVSSRIAYFHTGRDSRPDRILLQAFDGQNVDSVILDVVVTQRGSVEPVILRNSPLLLEQGMSLVLITNHNIRAVPRAEEAYDIMYTLTPTSGNPKSGRILYVAPLAEGDVIPHGWTNIGENRIAAQMFRFLQRDVDDGRIYYERTGRQQIKEDTITFSVSDTSNSPNVLENVVLEVKMKRESEEMAPMEGNGLVTWTPSIGRGNNLVSTTEELHQPGPVTVQVPERHSTQSNTLEVSLQYDSNKAPEVVEENPILAIMSGATVLIGPSVIQVMDEDTPLSELRFTLEETPIAGELRKKTADHEVILRKGDSFTYNEFENNVFFYTHIVTSSEAEFDLLWFTISDGAHRIPASVTLKIDPQTPSGPEESGPNGGPGPIKGNKGDNQLRKDPEASFELTVSAGDRVTLNPDLVNFLAAVPDDQVIVTLASVTTIGQLHRQGSPLQPGDMFSLLQLKDGQIEFFSVSNLDQPSATEGLYFNVTAAGKTLLYQSVRVTVIYGRSEPPEVRVGQPPEVDEGGRLVLTLDDIHVTDDDTPPGEISIDIQTPPMYGQLERVTSTPGSEKLSTAPVSSFTVEDLLQGRVHYVQTKHLEVEPTSDGFRFVVKDNKNTSPVYDFHISINLVNDERPQITTTPIRGLQMQQVVVDGRALHITDLDTAPNDMALTLLKVPLHGLLKLRGNLLDLSDKFKYEDFTGGLLTYTNTENAATDAFTLQITDGRFTETASVVIQMAEQRSETPRMVVNNGLRVLPGTQTPITADDLLASDLDSDDLDLTFKVTHEPLYGKLLLNGRPLTSLGDFNKFKQRDIIQGLLSYQHDMDRFVGSTFFSFSVTDDQENVLLDQRFIIVVQGDQLPPDLKVNSELKVTEGGMAVLTTKHLSAEDADTPASNITFLLLSSPMLGHLANVNAPDKPIMKFTQLDLVSGSVAYFHTSKEESFLDMFDFTLTDGTNEAMHMFVIGVIDIDDSVPVLSNNGLRVQEGVTKIISEFDIKVTDKDTQDDNLLFHVTSLPKYGHLELFRSGAPSLSPASFTMADIYNSSISYTHDGSETTEDSFSFTVTDGATRQFFVRGSDKPTVEPQNFQITILPVDDGTPIIRRNSGLPYLSERDGRRSGIINTDMLHVEDEDTDNQQIIYDITDNTRWGYIIDTHAPGVPLRSFNQELLLAGRVQYLLTANMTETSDQFTFDVRDSKPNIVPGNIFHIQWSYLTLADKFVEVSEGQRILRVKVKRIGNLQSYAVVRCEAIPGSATLNGRGEGKSDFSLETSQVQFNAGQVQGFCQVSITDDNVFEGPETFYLALRRPVYALLGRVTQTEIQIMDTEDKSRLQFVLDEFEVPESVGILEAVIERTGDLDLGLSVLCKTSSLSATGSAAGRLESGSDYVSRGGTHEFRVTFAPGQARAACKVQIIDDSESENAEQFKLELAEPSNMAELGNKTSAVVTIRGPNDESFLEFTESLQYFDEDQGEVHVAVYRQGSDLSHETKVLCSSANVDPPSALPAVDYEATDVELTFLPGQHLQFCSLVILDDITEPIVEGNETLRLVLSHPEGSSLGELSTTLVVINDTNIDGPVFEFIQPAYMVDESSGQINVTVQRKGDLHLPSSVICFTRQRTAQVMMDFQERMWTSESRIFFKPGEKFQVCSVQIVADSILEPDETFLLKLDDPQSEGDFHAILGLNTTTITISNTKDVPRVEFKEAYYIIPEPEVPSGVNSVHIKVIRQGDSRETASVRCSTKDGSAEAGKDYQAKSQLLTFAPGEKELDFLVNILHNQEQEWEEAFYVILGPQDPDNAMLGEVSMTTIAIVDSSGTGSTVLPAPPMVFPYDVYNSGRIDGTVPQPKPGQPLVCVSPCDPHYPTYEETGPLCEDMHIGQSDISYYWEVAASQNNWWNYEKVCEDTPFTDSTSMVLDSIYFQPDYRVRCCATPRSGDHMGTPVTSKGVTVQKGGGCFSHSMDHAYPPKPGGMPSLNGQSFIANMEYLPPGATPHPNTVHFNVKVPHQDGMLPLISTSPIHNIKLLLTQPVYRQHHSCSNFAASDDHPGFLSGAPRSPYAANSLSGIHPNSVDLYNHLDPGTCTWTFDAWYPMSHLVDQCGGEVTSNMGPQGRVDVQVPLYVSYVFNQGPGHWTSLDHHTDLQVHMDYNPVQWSGGMQSLFVPTGHVQLIKVSTSSKGNLVIDFKTTANFPGQFIGQAPNIEGIVSKVTPPKGLPLTFVLSQVNQELPGVRPGPYTQRWRAQSSHSVRDYTGMYYFDLIPCLWSTPVVDSIAAMGRCQPQEPHRFEVPIVYQQTFRPLPASFTLKTHFEVTNNPRTFEDVHPWGGRDRFDVAFERGQVVYGRVLWDPAQNLHSAYELRIEKVFICTGPLGRDLTFDPNGEKNGGVIQHGCLSTSPDVMHRTLILDREAPDVVVQDLGGFPLSAYLAGHGRSLKNFSTRPGEDAFAFQVDPLFQVGAGRQWYIQVLYTIQESRRRLRRSDEERRGENGSNVAKIKLHNQGHPEGPSMDQEVENNIETDKKTNAQQKTPNAQINHDSYAIAGKHLPYTVAILCTLAFLFIVGLTVFIRYKRKLIANTKNRDMSSKNSQQCTSVEHVGPQQYDINLDAQVQL